MLYKFPPPAWFETNTTSHLVLIIILWAIAIGLPASVLGCWILEPRSRAVWIAAETFWLLMAILSLPLWLPSAPQMIFHDVPHYLAVFVYPLLILLPFPAFVAGSNELSKQVGSAQRGFRSIPVWVGSVSFVVVMFGLLMPGFGHPREVSNRSQCRDHLKQIGLSMHNYLDAFQSFPDLEFQDDDSPPRSWRVEMLPFLKHQADYNAYDATAAWDSPSNLPLAKQDLRIYRCPSVPETDTQDALGRKFTAYAALVGPDTAFPGGKGLHPKQFSDGASNTVLIVEACGQQIVWTEPRDINLTANNLGINLPGNKLGHSPASWSSYHKLGANTLMGDGVVRFLNSDTDPQVLRAITTANGKEDVSDF